METAVVLPDPLGPSRPSTDPPGTLRLMPSRAVTGPKDFLRLSASMTEVFTTFPSRYAGDRVPPSVTESLDS
jgi:hypothetical protein